ncbi:hypothetical protein AB6A40_005770 [Gnathostoma spinigerum]|uniref:Uncharacterized protein n=1 Tax=Gnathostoma spinigerum TaxID=75299 RepID=A0ABD6ENQ0_9BILA
MTERTTDYGALLIKGSAAVVITISLALILLVVGNMIYQSFSGQVTLSERKRR